jgi:hypothetical protein
MHDQEPYLKGQGHSLRSKFEKWQHIFRHVSFLFNDQLTYHFAIMCCSIRRLVMCMTKVGTSKVKVIHEGQSLKIDNFFSGIEIPYLWPIDILFRQFHRATCYAHDQGPYLKGQGSKTDNSLSGIQLFFIHWLITWQLCSFPYDSVSREWLMSVHPRSRSFIKVKVWKLTITCLA